MTLRLNFCNKAPEVESRTQKKSEAKDTLLEDRPSPCQRTKDITRKVLVKGLGSKSRKFSQNSGDLHKKKRSSLENSQILWRAPAMLMTLANFQQVKNTAVLEPKTGHFRGLAGFQAKT